MLIKILSKIWPALTPILIYILWQYVLKRLVNKAMKTKKINHDKKNHKLQSDFSDKIIDGEAEEVIGSKVSQGAHKQGQGNSTLQNHQVGAFSLANKNFVVVLYISLIIAIISLITLAFS
jgi:hypothetical protein